METSHWAVFSEILRSLQEVQFFGGALYRDKKAVRLGLPERITGAKHRCQDVLQLDPSASHILVIGNPLPVAPTTVYWRAGTFYGILAYKDAIRKESFYRISVEHNIESWQNSGSGSFHFIAFL